MAKIIEWQSITEYDTELRKIDHYRIHPEMLPFIGSHYDNTRVLLVGESHYCSSKITADDKKYLKNDWYSKEVPKGFTDKQNFDTRFVIENFLSLKRSRAHSMFRNPAKSIIEAFELENVSDSEAFNICAFMNYYQKPALKPGASFEAKDEDKKNALKTFSDVCNVIKPNHIIFLSQQAYSDLSDDKKSLNINVVSHPTCAHWYKEEGKNKFERIIRSRSIDVSIFEQIFPMSKSYVQEKNTNNYLLLEPKQHKFKKNKITMKLYGKDADVTEIVVHSIMNGRQVGIGFVTHHSFIWLWDYDEKKYIDEEIIDDYPGLREMYDKFKKYIEAL